MLHLQGKSELYGITLELQPTGNLFYTVDYPNPGVPPHMFPGTYEADTQRLIINLPHNSEVWQIHGSQLTNADGDPLNKQ